MDEVKRFRELKESIESLKSQKIRLEERFNSKKERLESLINEITEKGYNPKELATVKQEKEESLRKTLDDIEDKVQTVSDKLNSIEA